MLSTIKSPLLILAVVFTLSMASCQSESIEPQPAPTLKSSKQGYQPPKDGNGGGRLKA